MPFYQTWLGERLEYELTFMTKSLPLQMLTAVMQSAISVKNLTW